MNSILFSALEDKDIETVIMACEEKKYVVGDYIIREGEQGDELFIVYKGELICEKTFPGNNSPTFLKNYYPGDSFGELALLYNAPRAASIYAKTECICYSLDRNTFNHIIKESTINKREKYKTFLKNIPLLKGLEDYEIYSICDAIKTQKFLKNTYIIHEGEIGDKFYVLDEGNCKATKLIDNKEIKVKEYKRGDYFGEIALLKDVKRQANVISETDVKLIFLDRNSFNRLLGGLKDKMSKETYQNYVDK